jgi:hypothetical protein
LLTFYSYFDKLYPTHLSIYKPQNTLSPVLLGRSSISFISTTHRKNNVTNWECLPLISSHRLSLSTFKIVVLFCKAAWLRRLKKTLIDLVGWHHPQWSGRGVENRWKSSKIIENHRKSPKITENHRKSPKIIGNHRKSSKR